MNRLKEKLNSERGASITWALLIFLVCAVVGSAVLVAGTAAAGRMSRLAENDQRYYAVNSAARLLIELIDDQTVTIVREKDGKGFKYTDGDTGDEISSKSLFTSIPLEAAFYLTEKNTSRPKYSIALSAGSIDALDVTVNESLTVVNEEGKPHDDGSMVLLVSKNDAGTTNMYSLRISFNVDKHGPEPDEEEREIYQYTWHIRDIGVVGSQRW